MIDYSTGTEPQVLFLFQQILTVLPILYPVLSDKLSICDFFLYRIRLFQRLPDFISCPYSIIIKYSLRHFNRIRTSLFIWNDYRNLLTEKFISFYIQIQIPIFCFFAQGSSYRIHRCNFYSYCFYCFVANILNF